MVLTRLLGAALVTGASQGIGKAIAMRLAFDGYKVALNDLAHKREQLEAVAEDIDQKFGSGTFVIPADVSQEEQVKQMISSTSKALDGLDVIVANAGIAGPFKPIADISMEEWDQVHQVNIRGLFMCYKWAAKEMIARGSQGRIIGASSTAGKQGVPNAAPYVASKFGIRGLTQTAALELGKYGITVNAYAPGPIETPMIEDILKDPSTLPQALNSLPSSAKVGQPEDIASIVSYLASKEAHYITGQTICVNAGMYFD
ncbi:hypothetical protein GYMLUDRAFT_262294 [Collybiopsis luxurians FD-317 M1]|uniref:Diacetyl reductase ((S)-acetoin forming) n=1 Tax=Collybiopsis luxurians FD-317 M1 TaxID=944289 RepID=A0A0D0CTE7_9AGAR|nr:hypothetical protein GYMLUDRAFT_262294 [Collybiopsis luxurians FD-317 M1]